MVGIVLVGIGIFVGCMERSWRLNGGVMMDDLDLQVAMLCHPKCRD